MAGVTAQDTRWRLVRRLVRTAAGAMTAALLLAGCAANEAGDKPSALVGTVVGAGSSAQAPAQEVWVSAFQSNNSRVTINYDPTGSGAGREQFIGGGVDFAGSDSALSETELAGEFAACAPNSGSAPLSTAFSQRVQGAIDTIE